MKILIVYNPLAGKKSKKDKQMKNYLKKFDFEVKWHYTTKGTFTNLNPDHYVNGNKVKWGENIPYSPSDIQFSKSEYSSISFPDSEVYVNHKFTDGDDKTILMGLKFYDIRNDQLFMQDRASWYKKVGNGDIFYFMPGHSTLEFENPEFSQMILNAINYTE